MTASKKVPAGAKVPADHKRPATDDFVFETEGGVVTLPPFSKAFTVGRLRKSRHQDELEQTFGMLEDLCDEGELALIDALDLNEFQRFQEEWQEHSRVTLGESTAS